MKTRAQMLDERARLVAEYREAGGELRDAIAWRIRDIDSRIMSVRAIPVRPLRDGRAAAAGKD